MALCVCLKGAPHPQQITEGLLVHGWAQMKKPALELTNEGIFLMAHLLLKQCLPLRPNGRKLNSTKRNEDKKMTTYYSVLPQDTMVHIVRSIKNTDSVNIYEVSVQEANDNGLWGSDGGTVGVSAYIIGSRDTLNSHNKNSEISVALINGIPCARTGFNHRDGKDRDVIEKGLWCQEDMPELREPWEML